MGVSRTMFSKFKSGSVASVAPNVLESNPIWHLYDIGKQQGTAGPENVWKILEGVNKKTKQEVSIFLFEKRSVEKIHKPKRKEAVTELLRVGVRHLERFRHPKILKVIHGVEECQDTIAFVSEPVLASLANVLASEEHRHLSEALSSQTTGSNSTVNHHHQQMSNQQTNRPVFTKDYEFLGIELKYGLLQCTEALGFLHQSCQVMHRNVCPSSIIITKRGTWKLFGFEFVERVNERDGIEHVPLPQWTNRLSKITQPNLDYLPPEVQQKKIGCTLSDMYSLGMVMAAIFNNGRPLIQANHNVTEYLKQQETLENHIHQLLPRVPVPLQESVTRLLHKDIKQRPTAQVITYIKYFNDPSVQAFQFLDVINMKDPSQKVHFYRTTLKEVLPYVPKKMWYMHIWPVLYQETLSSEVLAAVLQPIFYMIQNSTIKEYEEKLLPEFKPLFTAPRSTHGTVALIENLHIALEKSSFDVINKDMLPLLFTSFESATMQIQAAAFSALANVKHYLDDAAIRRSVLPKLKWAFQNSTVDQRILMNALSCLLDRLDKSQIIDEVLPLLWEIKLQDPEIIIRVVSVYRILLSDKKYGLSINIVASRVIPSLAPQTVNPALTFDIYVALFELMQELLAHIDRGQRNKLRLDNNLSSSSPERHRTLRHQYSTDNMHVPPFNIPNLRIEQRKTSSAEDMARKNSIGSMSMTASAENMTGRKSSMAGMIGSWWFGSTSSANADSNFLRVANTFTSRRLSDNTLMTPKIRIAPSCASSPGGTPGGGLPIRRHSSTGPQERRGSNINLSPPTGGGMPITSSSVPYLLSSSMSSIRGSRRPSVSSASSQQGSGLLQQFGSGMVRQLPPICLNLNGPPPPTLSPSLLQPSGQPSH